MQPVASQPPLFPMAKAVLRPELCSMPHLPHSNGVRAIVSHQDPMGEQPPIAPHSTPPPHPVLRAAPAPFSGCGGVNQELLY